MRLVFSALSVIISLYSLIIFMRIIFSWFQGIVSGRVINYINKITDPYLDWWRGKLNLRVGIIDFSVVAGIMFLYLLQSIFNMLSSAGIVTLGSILAMILLSVWSVVSFIGGFCVVVIILRVIAYLTKRNIFGQFWNAVDSISKPVIYKINRIIFGNKIINYLLSMIIPALILAVLIFGGRILINLLAGFLYSLPV